MYSNDDMVQMVRFSTSRSYLNIVESAFSGVAPPTSRTATHGGGRTGPYLKHLILASIVRNVDNDTPSLSATVWYKTQCCLSNLVSLSYNTFLTSYAF